MSKREVKLGRFEEGLKRLEQIVDELEKGDIPLERSIELFEEGKKLADLCKSKLDEAQQKVEMLLKSESGETKTVPFEEGEKRSSRPSRPAENEGEGEEKDDLPF
ncbi:MAG: exodeoxyribonuclease VII small subunit [Nitrospirae bacterium]|nr:exodeoxyribonuclease VII small subunit [Nitrospirota bacterium]